MKFWILFLLFFTACTPQTNTEVELRNTPSDIQYLNNDYSDFSWGENELWVYDKRIDRLIRRGESRSLSQQATTQLFKVNSIVVVSNDTLIDFKDGYKLYVTEQGTAMYHVRNILN